MGVPAFFRWLSRKYPSVIVECIEQKPTDVTGVKIPVDSATPNPNGVEFDNLYLDMNGIIHPCTHPEDKPAPKNEDEMMIAIFECIDRLFRIVRPRKLLYMAIDGVAPRAKMNQQRSRRFRASKETAEKVLEVQRIKDELRSKGYPLPPDKEKGEHFDSNCITPGTPFMDRLSQCLHYYVHERLQSDPGWRDIKVILSDANVPGEGEHKIMDYIRKQRAQPGHDPNTQHVLCGADADLIMLGLATHEPNFTIIREEFKPNQPRPCDICGQIGHEMKDCIGIDTTVVVDKAFSAEGQFIFVRLSVLREYLERELEMPNVPFEYDFERAIDDWVFMCFFVGNDFLPHLPSLEIRENAIDRLVTLYKKCVYKTGGYVTDSGHVNLERVQLIMSDLGEAEDEIFKKRQQNEISFKARTKNYKRRQQFNQNKPNFNLMDNTQFAPVPLGRGPRTVQNARQEAYQMRMAGMHQQSGSGGQFNSNMDWRLQAANQKQSLEGMLRPEASGQERRGQKRNISEVEKEDSEEETNDEVRLWEDGFKDRYYESKFDVSPDNLEYRYNIALEYVRGLSWVLQYYYQGCASWKWYFPYHYAPFASDFIDIARQSTEFEKGTIPFQPLQQLMGVFPAASSSHVPQPWAKLMSDPASPIIDFYPEDFKIDLNGKKFAWQGVALLPFVEESRLFKALEPYYDHLTQAEKRRNVCGDDRLYVNIHNSGFSFIRGLYKNDVDPSQETPVEIDGMQGTVLLAEDCLGEGGQLKSPVRGLPKLRDNTVYVVRFRDPKYALDFIFPAKKLKGAHEPPRVLKPGDLDKTQNQQWRPQIGMARSLTSASLDVSGHRALNHYTRGGGRGRGGGYGSNSHDGNYAAIPPPQQQQQQQQYYRQQQAGPYIGQYRGGISQCTYPAGGNQRGDNSYNNQRGGNSYNNQRNDNYAGAGDGDSWRRGGGGSRNGYSNNNRGNNNRGGYNQQQQRGGYQTRR